MYAPSHTNHIGDDWGDPSGRMVATWANCLECRIFWTLGFCKSTMDSPLCSGISRDCILFNTLSLRCNVFNGSMKTRRPANHRITESHGDQADHALPGLERAVFFSETPGHPSLQPIHNKGIQVLICKCAPGEDILMQRISLEQKETRN